MNISFALLEPHPLPTTSQLFRSPGLPQTRRVSLPWPEAVAGTWKARNSRSSGVSGTASVKVNGEAGTGFCFLERAGTSRPRCHTVSLGARTCPLDASTKSSPPCHARF